MSSNATSKRMKTEANTYGEVTSGYITEVSNTSTIAGSAAAASGFIISEEGVEAFIDVFTEDILPEIFDNLEILTVKDLLHFRLVNRCWRDVATSVLLKRNLCQIALGFGEVNIGVDNGSMYKYFNPYQPSECVADLSALISTSSKFPSTSISFFTACTSRIGNLSPTTHDSDQDQTHKDLLHFLLLYGRQIKSLTLRSSFPKQGVHNLLYVHMPHLISLDIQYACQFPSQDQDQDGGENQICVSTQPTLGIQEISIGYLFNTPSLDKSNFVKELISVSPNLRAIRNVSGCSLGVLLEMEKCHLIKDFIFRPTFDQMSILEEFINLLTSAMLQDNHVGVPTLQLCKLTIMFGHFRWENGNECIAVKYFNIILSASKDSLKHLDIVIHASSCHVNLFIPPLPHLKCLSLSDDTAPFTVRVRFLGDIIGRAVQIGEITADESADDFDSLVLKNEGDVKIPTDYLPSLRKVNLNINRIQKNNSNKLMDFFSVDHFGSDGVTSIPGDTILTVTTLKLCSFPWWDRNMSQIFPNVVHLNIDGVISNHLSNWVWTAFPRLEYFEIYLVCQVTAGTGGMDSFFTGISPELCTQFDSDVTFSESESRLAQVLDRSHPFIGDCENLKEFKMKFGSYLTSKCVSKATAVYGFSEVLHRTKIIFSFEGVNLSVKEIQETRQYLEPVAAFVEIRTRK